MKTYSLAVLFALPLCAQPVHVAPDQFPWRAGIDIADKSGYATVRIDRGFYEKTAARFRDLRLFAPSGVETPCMLRDIHTLQAAPSIEVHVLDLVRTAKGQLQFILDFGMAPPVHNRITFDVAEPDFRRTLLIESSLDRSAWDLVRTAALLRFQQDNRRFDALSIDYPDSARRYLRVTVDDWKDIKTFNSILAARTGTTNAADWQELANAAPAASLLTQQKTSRYEFTYALGQLQDARLVIESTTPEFYRSATLSYSTDGVTWISAVHGATLYRVRGAEELSFRVPALHTARLRLEVYDGDNAPIDIPRVVLQAPAREVVFPVAEAGRYTFYLGLAKANAPQYDLGKVLDRGIGISPVAAATPVWEANPGYIPPEQRPKPFTERFPWLLPSVVVIAVAGMGAAAWRLLKKPA